MPPLPSGVEVLSGMITPAVLILACGTLIASTSTRLARIVDRVRALSQTLEDLWTDESVEFAEARRAEVERQLASHAQRSRLIQRSLTSFYVSLGLFVATSIALGVLPFVPRLGFLPSVLGIVGTLVLFDGCVMLIRETRLALSSVSAEMAFVLGLRERYQARGASAGRTPLAGASGRPSRT